MTREARLAIALDLTDLDEIGRLAALLGPRVGALKIGLEAFLAHGPAVLEIVAPHAPIFLDLKLHDIPNTVGRSVRALRGHAGVHWLTVHASGGAAMLAAAADAADGRIGILAVTVLTSLEDGDLKQLGFVHGSKETATNLAELAAASGCAGCVCSPHEAGVLRARHPRPFALVVPGIRAEGSDRGDQRRAATPALALAAGADMLVVGRPVVATADPAASLEALINSFGAPANPDS